MKPEKRKYDNGKYILAYAPDNPRSYKDKYCYEHFLVAEKMLKRPLRKEEEVHHINGNSYDNRTENLLVLATHGQHSKLHNFLNRHNLNKAFESTKTEGYFVYECCACGEYLRSNKKFCNSECQNKYREWKKQQRPSLEEIQELLDQNYNKVEIGQMLGGFHRSTINSWLREYGVDLSVK